jgi:hypothetical protein
LYAQFAMSDSGVQQKSRVPDEAPPSAAAVMSAQICP